MNCNLLPKPGRELLRGQAPSTLPAFSVDAVLFTILYVTFTIFSMTFFRRIFVSFGDNDWICRLRYHNLSAAIVRWISLRVMWDTEMFISVGECMNIPAVGCWVSLLCSSQFILCGHFWRKESYPRYARLTQISSDTILFWVFQYHISKRVIGRSQRPRDHIKAPRIIRSLVASYPSETQYYSL